MQSLDAAFFALADPTRRAILARLALGETTVMELAAPFEMSQPAVSRHLRVLEDAGLIARRVDGTKRPCRLQGQRLVELEQWLAMMRDALARNYDRLDGVLAKLQADGEGRPESGARPAAARKARPAAARKARSAAAARKAGPANTTSPRQRTRRTR
ncbi:MAG: winged helix-turn-helix domain-containing protein [Vicinamibacteraceae bacterium]|nr:winged helix-turn-helix domain-containing protein [Vicinamibacteraceae bacterium]